jgi:thioredoxin
MKTKILLLLLVTTLLTSCQGQTSKSLQTLDTKTYSEKIKSTENPQLIDVRTPEEYASEHIDFAKNINWNGDNFVAQVEKLDKTKPVFVYCKVGGRSSQAANKLSELGFKEIYNLDGGIMKWNSDGYGKKDNAGKIIGMCDQEYGDLLKSSKRVLVDFNAKWCAPCKKMKPYIIKLQEEMKDKIKIVQLDADENKTLVDQMKLEGLPTIIIYEDGKEVWRNLGYISEEDLRKHL